MEIVAGVMNSLLPKLGELLTEEYKLQSDLKKSVQSLTDELMSMTATLRDMAKQPPDKLSEQDKLWAGEVRELSYDAEDVVDTYMVCVAPGYEPDATQVSRFIKFMEKVTDLFTKGPRRDVAVASQDLKCLAKELGERRKRYKFTPAQQESAAPTAVDPRHLALLKEVKDLVGIQDSANKLLALLFKEGDDDAPKNTTVVSIVGCGGIGKTSLARKVLQECKEKHPFSFAAFVFVSVSLNPDIPKLLESMLRELDKEKYKDIGAKAWNQWDLIKELKSFLKDRRYFIVFDDIWDMEQWEIIKLTLANNDRGNKIITTTRHKKVAEGIGGAYFIEPLSVESSKILFHKKIFGNQRECPLYLAELSEKILQKCGGIPLAIITIASLLASKKGRSDEWERVYRTMGSGIEGTSRDVESMRKILSLSYYNLDLHLRRCLLYLTIFPEDFEIRRDRLIWRWISEGLIGHENPERQVLFDTGIEYFNELINRCMIEPAGIDYSQGSAEACRLHDMVLDLLNVISSEENFVAIVGGEKEFTPGPKKKIRRLSIQNTTKERQTAYVTQKMPHARSVTLFNPATKVMPSLSKFKVLRVLDLEDCDLRNTNHLEGIGRLLHLRYLGLRHTGIAELPREVGNLQALQTLDVRCRGYRFLDDHMMKELPSTIVNLRNLICLYVDEKTQLPKGMHNLTSLEQLSIVDVDNSRHFVKELGHLREMRVLDINWFWINDGEIEDLIMSIKSLHNIRSLSVSNTGHSCLDFFELEGWDILPGHLQRFRADFGFFTFLPEWISSPGFSNLSELSITVAQLTEVDFQVLGALPVLCSLELELTGEDERMKVEEKITVRVGSTAFPCLRIFSFREFDLGPMFPPKVMQRVERLDFSFRVREIIDANDDFDFGLKNLLSLDHVSVDLDNDDAKRQEVEAAEAALRGAINNHRKIPTLEMEFRSPHWDEASEDDTGGGVGG